MANSVKNFLRLLRIGRTLARYDALFLMDEAGIAPIWQKLARFGYLTKGKGRPGQRLSQALQDSGPSFIKLGQALSTRSDLLGEELCNDLSHLQDQLPPFPSHQARAIVEEQLGQPIDALFSEFDDTAVAAASIAQVHFAKTIDGREVAVKILRPGIEDKFHNDLSLFRWGAALLEKNFPEARRLKPCQSVEVIAETVEMEMDLRFEAAAAAEMADNFEGDTTFHIPRPDWSLTAKRVMTIERITGVPIDDRQAILDMGLDPHVVLTNAANAFFNQIFRDGFFHADLHPGNLFVDSTGCVNAVDFGIMGRMDIKNRRFIGEMLLGFLTRDFEKVADVHFRAGWIPAHKSRAAFTQAARSIAEPILDKPQNEISIAKLLGLLFQVTRTFDMEAQPDLLLLQKTMLVAEGTARSLDPQANMWVLARPLIEQWMIKNLGPEARLKSGAYEALQMIERLPKVIENLENGAAMVASGSLKLHPDTVKALRGDPKTSFFTGLLKWAIIVGGLVVLTHLIH